MIAEILKKYPFIVLDGAFPPSSKNRALPSMMNSGAPLLFTRTLSSSKLSICPTTKQAPTS